MKNNIQNSLNEIENRFGIDICNYIKKVINAEKKQNGEDAEDIIALAYIVLTRAETMFDPSIGEFKNYAIRSLKNELLRSKSRKELFYDNFLNNNNENNKNNNKSIQQVSKNDNIILFSNNNDNENIDNIKTKELAKIGILFLAMLHKNLTPYEKSLIYYMHFISEDSRKPSLRHFSEEYNISYFQLINNLKKSLETLKNLFIQKNINKKIEEIKLLLK